MQFGADHAIDVGIQKFEVFIDLPSNRAIRVRVIFRISKMDVLEREFENGIQRDVFCRFYKPCPAVLSFLAFYNVMLFEVGDFLANQYRVQVHT